MPRYNDEDIVFQVGNFVVTESHGRRFLYDTTQNGSWMAQQVTIKGDAAEWANKKVRDQLVNVEFEIERYEDMVAEARRKQTRWQEFAKALKG